MYKIKRSYSYTLPKCLKGSFFSYERARSAVRKYIRKTTVWARSESEAAYSNPCLCDYGFSIHYKPGVLYEHRT